MFYKNTSGSDHNGNNQMSVLSNTFLVMYNNNNNNFIKTRLQGTIGK